MATNTAVWGVLNVTPDSFSDGGLWLDPAAAVEHAHAMIAAGASVIDVGGESTRPGAARVEADDEERRVVPVIHALAQSGITVSVDTMRATVARAAMAAGATYINDVSGGLADPDMAEVAAETGAIFVAMHWRAQSDVMDDRADYTDVVSEVLAELSERTAALRAAGIPASKLWIDPGLGFAKTAEHNWALLQALPRLNALGFPVLVGASRKRFLAEFAENPADRDLPTAVISALAAMTGVAAVRVHDVASSATAIQVAELWSNGGHNVG
ncbi:dihydropteroate synthase [Microbacteriaceae bacterium MWH-Ta3]|nr:dihydropteroate synthase [Microbacteriaceae bacterium MWH-Ta3]